MAREENFSIGIFIDGGYYAKINEGFAGTKEVNLKGLLSFICGKIAQDNNLDRKRLHELRLNCNFCIYFPLFNPLLIYFRTYCKTEQYQATVLRIFHKTYRFLPRTLKIIHYCNFVPHP